MPELCVICSAKARLQSRLMAVFTQVTPPQAQQLLDQLGLGTLLSLRGIEGGIENTNYFLDVMDRNGRHPQFYVLTLFERLTAHQLPFYLGLMQHLASKGLPVPNPAASPEGQVLFEVAGKPAALVTKLEGKSQLDPQAPHCHQLGATLAHMHLATVDFAGQQPNLRGLTWWNETVPVVTPFLNADQRAMIEDELALQNAWAQSDAYAQLPRGAVHADLFRDNVMFVGDQLTGVFDFYFAGVDTWLFDLAVALNDWCIDRPTGAWIVEKKQALLQGYQSVRPLLPAERDMMNPMLRAGALRFWTSRLWDFFLPREASMLKPHDPTHFERVLHQRRHHPVALETLLP